MPVASCEGSTEGIDNMQMRRKILSALFCVALGSVATSCANSPDDNHHGVTETGTLSFPLSTQGESGTTYNLRNAIFEIRDVRTGRVRATLDSDDEPFSPIMRAEVDSGDYIVSLLPGWFIEVDDGGFDDTPPPPFPGPVPVPGFETPPGGFEVPIVQGTTGTGSSTQPAAPGVAVEVGPVEEDAGEVFTDEGFEEELTDEDFEEDVTDVFFEDDFFEDDFPDDDFFPGEQVNAVLESDAIQNITVFPNSESFVFFTFRVGDNVINFGPGGVNVIFEVIEDGVGGGGDLCSDPDAARRASVMETNVDAVSLLSLREAFDFMAANEGFDTDGETLYKQIIDSYASAANAQMPDAVHCGDETTDGQPTLNGYPILCDRAERFQFDNLDFWFPTAFVNRFDLAPVNGAHCGQQRMIFANNEQGRMFFILEAQIPNPNPDAGIDGCMPLAEFWAEQTQIEDAFSRGIRLFDAFFFGNAELAESGFGPFVTASNYTVGSGQIRTNNFDDFIWTLREFKLSQDDGELKAIPFPVAESPHGNLWNDSVDLPAGAECREAFLESAQGVLTGRPAQMSFVVPQACKDAESQNDFSQAYADQMFNGSGDLVDQLDELGDAFGLTAGDIATRAQFAGSCIGCHSEANGNFLGGDFFAPFSLDFVHVGEFTDRCPDGQTCFAISQALQDEFLPHRIDVLDDLVGVELPPQCVDGEEPGFDAGVGVPVPGLPDPGVAMPPSIQEPVAIAEADVPMAELVEADEAAREEIGGRTLGGQLATVNH